MSGCLIGNLIGRFVTSVLIVYLGQLLFHRFQFKIAAQKLKHPVSIVLILVIWVLGILAGASS